MICQRSIARTWLRLAGHTYHVIAKNCRIQKMIARPLFCHCKIKQKWQFYLWKHYQDNNDCNLFWHFYCLLTQNTAQSVRMRQSWWEKNKVVIFLLWVTKSAHRCQVLMSGSVTLSSHSFLVGSISSLIEPVLLMGSEVRRLWTLNPSNTS